MIKIQNIDAILFDMMGVLLFQRNDYVPSSLVDETDTLAGRVTDDVAFEREMLNTYHLSEEDFTDILTKIVNKYEPFKKLWDSLPELRKHYKLAIVNNGTGLTLPQFDKKLNFNKNFDLFISSAKEGVKKPSRDIYLTTAKRLAVAPERCLFMDDSEINVAGAKRIGMQTILWSDRDEGFNRFTDLIGI